ELEDLAVGPLLVLDLEVAEGGPALGAPVDEPRGAVHQPLLVQAHEGLDDRAVHRGIHREPRPRPVGRAAEPALLQGDAPAALGLPLPDALDEGLAAEGLAAGPFAGELALDHELRRDAGVVEPGLPEGVVA